MDRPQLLLRRATPDDLKFVRHSWFESYRKGGRAPDVRFDVYAGGQRPLIERITESLGATIAYPREIPDEICGWICYFGRVVHYVYVKQAYRRLGIAAQLLAHREFEQYTQQTRVGMKLASKRGLVFNPYLLHP